MSTSRPETMLGDVAVAVHPDDPHYQVCCWLLPLPSGRCSEAVNDTDWTLVLLVPLFSQALHGKQCRHPFTHRLMPIIADPTVDMDFGTGEDAPAHCSAPPLGRAVHQPLVRLRLCPAGAVKVTPAHDHADFQLSQRHSLPRLTVIDGDGSMTAQCGDWLQV